MLHKEIAKPSNKIFDLKHILLDTNITFNTNFLLHTSKSIYTSNYLSYFNLYKMELTTIIVFLIPVVVARHNHRTVLESILKSTDNLYAKLHNDVQNVMNNLFDGLNLSPNFPEKSRIKLFLTMHYDLNNMAAKNYDEHVKMIDAARPDTGNRSSNGLALFKLIEKTLGAKPFNLLSVILHENKTTTGLSILENTIVQQAATIPTATPTSLENINPSDPVFADSKEFMQFIKDFIKKVDKLNETDFSKSTPLLPPIEEITTQPDIEFWQPPAVDYFNDTKTRRIFKGKRSAVKSYPFVVSIHLFETFVCAGSIVSSDLVITAASCLQLLHNNRFFRENPRSVEVRIGSDYFIRGGEMIGVLETFFYPTYNPKTLAHNLVLLRLIRHIRFGKHQSKVKKIRYDRTKGTLPVNINGITVLGWGSRKRNNIIEQFERVMATKLDVYQLDECALVYSRQYVTHRHFCAGFISKGGGACNKDLGGPGVSGGLLVGVISFGAQICGAVDAPTVFTTLGHYDQWIDDVIEENGRTLNVRTTRRHRTEHYFYDPTPPPRENPYVTYETTRGTVTPITMFPEGSREEEVEEERGPVFRGRRTPKIQIQQLFPYTPTTRESMFLPIQILRSIIYEDYGMATEDFNGMFKSTQQTLPVKQHPLVNLSVFPVPGVHTRKPTGATKLKTFSPVPLTTSPGPRPPRLNDARSTPPVAKPTGPSSAIPNINIIELVTVPEIDPETIHNEWITTPDSPVTTTEPSSTEPTTLQPTKEPVYIEYYYDLLRV